MVQGEGRGEQGGDGVRQGRTQAALEDGGGLGAPGRVGAGQPVAEAQREGAGEVVRDVRLAAVGRDDRAAERFEFARGDWRSGIRWRCCGWQYDTHHLPSSVRERAVGVRDFDEEVSAGAQTVSAARSSSRGSGVCSRWWNMLTRRSGPRAAAARSVSVPRCASSTRPGPRLLDARVGSSPSKAVYGWISLATAGKWPCPVPTSSQLSGSRRGSIARAAARWRPCPARAREDPLGEAVGWSASRSVVEVPVVEGQALGGQAGVLEGVGAVPALVDDEGAGLVLQQVRGTQPGAQPLRAAPGAVVPAGLVEPVGALGEFAELGGAAFGGGLRGWGAWVLLLASWLAAHSGGR